VRAQRAPPFLFSKKIAACARNCFCPGQQQTANPKAHPAPESWTSPRFAGHSDSKQRAHPLVQHHPQAIHPAPKRQHCAPTWQYTVGFAPLSRPPSRLLWARQHRPLTTSPLLCQLELLKDLSRMPTENANAMVSKLRSRATVSPSIDSAYPSSSALEDGCSTASE
jgi:hypothetical protein